MPTEEYLRRPWKAEDRSYARSVLWPIAPEYTTGEVLLGSTYRKVILGRPEILVNLREVDELPGRLGQTPAEETAWKHILHPGALSSPIRGGQRSDLPQLMPLVPAIAWFASVLGKQGRNRWDPGNLLLQALSAGVHSAAEFERKVDHLRIALQVDERDDLFARFVERELSRQHPGVAQRVDRPNSIWRSTAGERLSPAESFCRDLDYVLALKERVTRRQWTVLLESLLRLGLGTHILWLCRLNARVWEQALECAETGEPVEVEEVESTCWEGTADPVPLLELGQDALPLLHQHIENFARSRIGLNLTLYALSDAGHSWTSPLAQPTGASDTPLGALTAFFTHIALHASAMAGPLAASGLPSSLREAAARVADRNPGSLSGRTGPMKNLFEFLRYALGELRPQDPQMSSYDQGYLLFKKNKTQPNSPWLVQPGPAASILMVHASCRADAFAPTSVDDFRAYLAGYGIAAPAGELQSGRTGRELEQLGLVVDSPDAGGGRLFVDPF